MIKMLFKPVPTSYDQYKKKIPHIRVCDYSFLAYGSALMPSKVDL